MNHQYVTPEKASKTLKVTTNTLRLWADDGKIEFTRTKGGQRRYLLSSVIGLHHPELKDTRTGIVYARVSSYEQRKDLDNQISCLSSKYPNHRVFKDIGSGINLKRKGLKAVLELAIKGDIQEVVVTHKDRLCRFGFELIEWIVQTFSHGRIVVLDQQKKSQQEELVDDLISIITVFSARIYGSRSHSIKKALKDIENSVVSE